MRRRGFTLVEMVLAIGLLVLLTATMFGFYDGVLRAREQGRVAVKSGVLAQRVAHQIAEEIRSCNGFLTSMGPGVSGTDRFISIQCVRFPGKQVFRRRSITEEAPPAECDIRQVQYYLGYDREEETEPFVYPDGTEGPRPLGLVRREVKTPFQLAFIDSDEKSVALDVLSEELTYLRFRYFDGVDWTDYWDVGEGSNGGNSLPQAVEITVGYQLLPPPEEEEDDQDQTEEDRPTFGSSDLLPALPEPYSPETYTVTVRLMQADTFFGSRLMRAQEGAGLGATGGGQ
ncbi:MAG TPA: prepilin-type N-terminal cleavage/methylation domain-containing protein [Phycisphaerae bacterium]|nr:prepilin-type N-terminal cleavage/methylation domain-containing protein [Phycisphaerae bacterium]HRW55307.1 prepilin-type N-terminal cleavage/methylation domain-containing protein [Phycisphaerae bacterium]